MKQRRSSKLTRDFFLFANMFTEKTYKIQENHCRARKKKIHIECSTTGR